MAKWFGWNEEGGICGVGEKHCAICASGDGGCLATMREDLFSLASERQLVERLNEGKYPNYKQLMIDTLKRSYNHEYTGTEELEPLPKQLNCCTQIRNLCDTCRKVMVCPVPHINLRDKCELYEKLPNPLDEIVNENTANTYIESQKPKSWIEERDEIICPHCGYVFSDEIRLMGHGKELPLNFCPVCGKEVDDSKR